MHGDNAKIFVATEPTPSYRVPFFVACVTSAIFAIGFIVTFHSLHQQIATLQKTADNSIVTDPENWHQQFDEAVIMYDELVVKNNAQAKRITFLTQRCKELVAQANATDPVEPEQPAVQPVPATTIRGPVLEPLKKRNATLHLAANETWDFGPKQNLYTPGPVEHYVADGHNVARDTAGTLDRRDLRIARMTFRQGIGNLNANAAFIAWHYGLEGIIDESEIAIARSVLDAAMKKIYHSELKVREDADTTIPSDEGTGNRFRTKVRILKRSIIEIELHWLNPKEPEAIDARKDLPRAER